MTTALLPALAAYIPRDRVDHIINGTTMAEDGVSLIADISGFTPLTEALTQGLTADHGAEELTRALDSVFTPLIAELHQFGGSVIKFGGDALIVWFGRARGEQRRTLIRRALTAAWRMQQAIGEHGRIPTPIGVVTLKMKIGLAYGPVKRFHLGLPSIGFEDVLVGATLDRMSASEHEAQPGDIMLDRQTWALVPTAVTISEWRNNAGVVAALLRPSTSKPWPALDWPPAQTAALVAELASYVPVQIVETLRSGQTQVAELKPVLSLFVQFHGLDYDADTGVVDKLQTYFVAAQRIVARYDGRLNRLITGDKGSLLHILFGAPRSVEEQEERAVRCALDLQAECAGLPFITMQRIGVTSGRVFAGPVGAPRRHDYTTMGDAINLSARLMQNAAADQVLMDATVVGQLSPAIRRQDLGRILVKGKAQPIHVFAAESVGRQARSRLPAANVFGRDRELQEMRDQIAGLSGGGGIVCITGEVGLGKTLLLDTLRFETESVWRFEADGGIWANGISLAYGNTLTGYLFIELLRDLLNLAPGATPEQASLRLRRLCEELFGDGRVDSSYPYLAKFMNLPLPPALAARLDSLAGESLRWQLFELVPEMVRLICARVPLVLALDDLQWADPTTLQLLNSLAPLTAELPLLLLVALRPETETGAWELIQSWQADERLMAHHTLATLPAHDVTALIRFQAPELPDRVVDYLVSKGGGNPLFLVELVRTLQLSEETDMERLQLDALALPNSVQGLLLAQLDRLAVESRRTLQLASVIGKTFLDQVLAHISTAEQQLPDLLAELTSSDYVRPDQADLGAAHTFRHALIQEGAYSTLLHERRHVYHRRVAETFEELFPAAISDQAAFLAYQYEQAAELERAIDYILESADRSRLLYAHEEAEKLYGRALNLMESLPKSDPQMLASLYLRLAQVKANNMDFGEAQSYYDEAFAYLARIEPAVEPDTFREQRALRWGIMPGYLKNFDPSQNDNAEMWQITANLFESLVEVDNEWNIRPACARRWEVLDDGRRYIFHLRDDLRWSDGRKLTAHDFVFAWERNLDPERDAAQAYQLFNIKGAAALNAGSANSSRLTGVAAVDETTLEIQLENPSPYFPYILAHPITYPQPVHLVERFGDDWAMPERIVGNGPYRVDMAPGAGEAIRLRRNPYYAGYCPGNLAEIVISEAEPTPANYDSGINDWCRIDDQAIVTTQEDGEVYLIQGYVTYNIGFACRFRPFDDPRVRRAFAQCIDREMLVQQVWGGAQRAASGGLIPPGMRGHSPEAGLAFDPEQAARAIVASGLKPGDMKITLVAFPGFGQTPAFLQAAWRDHLGIEVDVIENLPIEEAVGALTTGQAHILLSGFNAEIPDPGDILQGYFHSDSPANVYGWHNPEFDRLVVSAAKALDPEQRFAQYHQADLLAVGTDAVAVPLYYLQRYGLLRQQFRLQAAGKVLRGNTIKFKNISVSG